MSNHIALPLSSFSPVPMRTGEISPVEREAACDRIDAKIQQLKRDLGMLPPEAEGALEIPPPGFIAEDGDEVRRVSAAPIHGEEFIAGGS